MKRRIFIFFSIFLFFTLIFVIEKVVFTLIHASVNGGASFSDILSILYHGLQLDLSVSGYLTAIPGLLLILSLWIEKTTVQKVYSIYFLLVFSILSIIAVSDTIIYNYWGFHLDASILFYLKNPKEAFSSTSVLFIFLGVLATFAFVFILYKLFVYLIISQIKQLPRIKIKASCSGAAILFVLVSLLFLPIRGGVTVSTMNIGKAYFSERMFLNHAAINPHFSILYSLLKTNDFGSQYQFFDKNEAREVFAELRHQPGNDSVPQLLNTDRPNIILFILESFSANVAFDPQIAPNMCQFTKEGVLFNNFYANSYRTDRGLSSILSGYPGHPTASILKYPRKSNSLPAIPKSLEKEGYHLSFHYGGDVDFTNMRSYLVGGCRIGEIHADSDYPINQRMSKWGAADQFLIDHLYADLGKNPSVPFMKTVLTLSSHEPFDVPVNKFEEPFLNSIAYTDECLGNFIKKLRQTEIWSNTLVILVADHCMQSYPPNFENNRPERFLIPMLWIGGAVKQPYVVSAPGSQNDLAATLLAQLKINHDDFPFSKDMLNPSTHKFAFYSYVNGFSMIDSAGVVVFDNDKNMLIRQEGDPGLEKKAKVFFQNMYMDLGNR